MNRASRTESPTIRSYRELLGVGPTATLGDLKKAYHKLALLYHPDRNPGSEAAVEFQRVHEAYEILCDSKRVQELNASHARERLFTHVVEGLNICFGSFFGYRLFNGPGQRIERRLRLGREQAGESDSDVFSRHVGPIEQDSSILDNPAYDAIEIVYGGKFSVDDEERLAEGMDSRTLTKLPWVVLNNQGILHFLDGDIRKARRCYEELVQRMPLNIIFMYRLGLCHVLEGFQNPKRTLLGFVRPDRIEIEKGLRLFRQCIRIGETRPVGKQRCRVIRKIMADVLEKTGRRRQSVRIWRDILADDPKAVEATWKAKGLKAAQTLLETRRPKSIKKNHDPSRLIE